MLGNYITFFEILEKKCLSGETGIHAGLNGLSHSLYR